MSQAQKTNLIPSPETLHTGTFAPTQDSPIFQTKCLKFAEEIYAKEGRIMTEDEQIFYREFARQFGVDYCPVYSVLGSVCCQEIIKIIGRKNGYGRDF